jgi:hypothetical protein
MQWNKHKEVVQIRSWMWEEIQGILDEAEKRIAQVD